MSSLKAIGKAYTKAKSYDEPQNYYMECPICANKNRIHKTGVLLTDNAIDYVFYSKCANCNIKYESDVIGSLTRGRIIYTHDRNAD